MSDGSHPSRAAISCFPVPDGEEVDAEAGEGECKEACVEECEETVVEALEDGATQLVGVVALGHEDRGQRSGVLALVEAQHLEPPLADGGAGGGGVPLVAREDVLQPLGREHVERGRSGLSMARPSTTVASARRGWCEPIY